MKVIKKIILFSFALGCMQYLYAGMESHSPIGYWQTIDDATGKVKSIVQISQSSDNSLSGKVVKLYPGALTTCTACEGVRKNQPILGMVIMEHFKQNEKTPALWKHGEILDPKNGKTYHCQLTVVENGQKLNVRGYIGVPMLGRSQSWVRATNIENS